MILQNHINRANTLIFAIQNTMLYSSLTIITLTLCTLSYAQKDPHFLPNRHTIVHLFEWKWSAIANECENFLKPKGYGGVQISPPNENLVIQPRPWWERYQPVSYKLKTRSGDEKALTDMIKRCNKAGVRIFVDTVVNHMSASGGTGTAGSTADGGKKSFPAVPYSFGEFHDSCAINNYQDPNNVRNCELDGLKDLNQGIESVRGKIVNYMNHLIDLGVAGFRMDAAKHMWPADLKVIYSRLKNLNTDHGFPNGAKPFIYQEVIDLGGEPISKHEYTGFGTILEFQYGISLGNTFQGGNKLSSLQNFGPSWNLVDGYDAVAFIDNHDNQRTGGSQILTYKKSKQYKMAIAFMLAHPYGITRVMSSYAFDNKDQAPPHDGSGNLVSPGFNSDNTCTNGYICEHRWQEIYNMVGFRNVVTGSGIEKWWSNNDQQIAFSRGNKGFIAFTQKGNINQNINTNLPAGTYCDVISGSLVNSSCTGKKVVVNDGKVFVSLADNENDGVLAIHVNAKL